MPQERRLLSCTPVLKVEHVLSHAVAPEWSPAYRAPSARLVVPAGGALEFRTQGVSLLADALTVFRVDGAAIYQLRPCTAQPRASVVVSEPQDAVLGAGSVRGVEGTMGAVTGVQPRRSGWLLTPRALYRLRLHWRALAQGGGAPEATLALLAAALALAPAPCSEGPVGRARRFLAAQPAAAAGLTLQEVAEEACSSPFHLARSFRRAMGLSPHQYRLRLRMAQALARLQDGERDLAGLAHDLGFCGQSHLGAVFQREVGVTPGQARAALNG